MKSGRHLWRLQPWQNQVQLPFSTLKTSTLRIPPPQPDIQRAEQKDPFWASRVSWIGFHFFNVDIDWDIYCSTGTELLPRYMVLASPTNNVWAECQGCKRHNRHRSLDWTALSFPSIACPVLVLPASFPAACRRELRAASCELVSSARWGSQLAGPWEFLMTSIIGIVLILLPCNECCPSIHSSSLMNFFFFVRGLVVVVVVLIVARLIVFFSTSSQLFPISH